MSACDWHGGRRARADSAPHDWSDVGRRESQRAAIGQMDAPPPAGAGSGSELRDPVSVGAALWRTRLCVRSSRRGLSLSSLPLSPLPPSLPRPSRFLPAPFLAAGTGGVSPSLGGGGEAWWRRPGSSVSSAPRCAVSPAPSPSPAADNADGPALPAFCGYSRPAPGEGRLVLRELAPAAVGRGAGGNGSMPGRGGWMP